MERPFDPGQISRTSLPRFKITPPPLSEAQLLTNRLDLGLPPQPSRPRNEHPVTLVSFPSAVSQPPWISSPLPVPKKSHSARRFAKPNSAIISVTSSVNSVPNPPLAAILSHKSNVNNNNTNGRAKTGKLPSSSSATAAAAKGVEKSKNMTKKDKGATKQKTTEKTEDPAKSTAPPELIQGAGARESTRILVPVSSFSLVKCQNQASNTVGERMQVVRTEDEKSKSPDTLRLDKCGLEQFPLIYPASEPRLKLISMQHNLITRLENVPCLNHLVVLDLYDNRIERITGLQGLNSLRVLLLGKNRLRRIEGLDSLKRLEVLDLHGNQLRFVGNLGCLSSLRVLNLAGNHFKTVRLGQYGMTALVELNLKRNRIRNVEGLQKAPHIKKLLLSNNELASIGSIYPLRKLLFLQELLLHPNPLCSSPEYVHQVVSLLPSVEIVDRAMVTDQMRSEAKAWHRKFLADEEDKRAAQAKAKLPTSREQVIFEARQRWQSVKNFVRAAVAVQEAAAAEKRQQKSQADPSAPQVEPQKVTTATESDASPEELPRIATEDPDEGIIITKSVLEAKLEVDTAISDQDSSAEEAKEVRSNSSEKVSKIAVVRPLLRYEEDQELQPIEMLDCPLVLVQDMDGEGEDDEDGNESIFKVQAMNLNPVPPFAEEECGEDSQVALSDSILLVTDDIETDVGLAKSEPQVQPVNNYDMANNNNNLETPSPDYSKDMDTEPGELLNIFPKPRKHHKLLKRSASSISLIPATIPEKNINSNDLAARRKAAMSGRTRSASLDVIQPSSGSDSSDDDTASFVTVNTSESSTTASGLKKNKKFMFRSRTRIKRDRPVTAKPGAQAAITSSSSRRPQTCVKDSNRTAPNSRQLRRSDSNLSQTAIAAANAAVGMKKQGVDYLVEIDGKTLNVYGQGALKFTLMGFPNAMTGGVTTAKFHYISFDTIIPYFSKLRQVYPNMEHFQFRANNLTVLSQLNSLADLQGIKSLHIMKEGNPIVGNELWISYATYRLAHWGLQVINGKEVSSDHKCNSSLTSIKAFESLGYVALSCLPQTALTPLAKKLHSLHCFCCCSPSSSSDDSGRRKAPAPASARPDAPESVCRTWDDDPVLLDVIGKEALVYSSPFCDTAPGQGDVIAKRIINSGVETLQKLDLLEQVWPSVLAELVQDILMDYLLMDTYMKKEHKKLQDLALITKKS